MKTFQLNTPVLFLTFNRLDTTKKVFAEIQKAKPKQLFLASDGPRNEKEKKVVQEIRNYLLKNITWDCKVKKLFRTKNLGCKYAVSSAIDWFFENVEQGIILEDDCLPSQSFFRFCQEMLEKYKEDERITGVLALSPTFFYGKNSYSFVKIIGLWGWATWGKAWKKIYRNEERYSLSQEKNSYLKEVFPNFFERFFFKKRFLDSLTEKVNTWEFPWVFGIIRKNGLNIMPKRNLVENLGVKDQFTNTKPNVIDNFFLKTQRENLKFPLKHPQKIILNKFLCFRLMFRDFLRVFLKKLFFFF